MCKDSFRVALSRAVLAQCGDVWQQVMRGPTALLARLVTSGKPIITGTEALPQEELSSSMTACSDGCLLSTGFRVMGGAEERQLCAAATFTRDVIEASTLQEPESLSVVYNTLASMSDIEGMRFITGENIVSAQPVTDVQMKPHCLSSALCLSTSVCALHKPLDNGNQLYL